MASLLHLLEESEPALLPLFAAQWGVKIDAKDRKKAIKLLLEAMSDRGRAEAMWEKLNDAHRGALQVLISNQSPMAETMFMRLFGEIRRLGAAQIERERPLENPAGTAEALFYRGLIGIAYESASAGARSVVYIPEDLLRLLPVHKTSYDQLDAAEDDFADDEVEDEEPLNIPVMEKPADVRMADTSVVDDLTTLLAFIQMNAPTIQQDTIVETADLLPHLLVQDAHRLVFLLGLAASAGFLESDSGKLFIKRAEARRWLEAARADQVRVLAEAWRKSEVYHDLWHVPGLIVEREAGTMPQYNPLAAREAMIALVENAVPRDQWWSQDALIDAMFTHDHDFQRPNGDYTSWYIRNESNEYLTGEESWNAVDGALLDYYMNGPLYWLGLVDLAENGARLTAYGRAFIARKSWPQPQEATDKIAVREDGTLLVSRKVGRIDRFQIARFATWIQAGDPYTYRLDGGSISRAAEQGIHVGHIAGFLDKANGGAPLPVGVKRLLENWQGGAKAAVSLERLLVLRATSSETVDFIFDTPALRRYLGARLGPLAVVVRAEQAQALQAALAEQGIEAEWQGD
jgi:hypothetical protein